MQMAARRRLVLRYTDSVELGPLVLAGKRDHRATHEPLPVVRPLEALEVSHAPYRVGPDKPTGSLRREANCSPDAGALLVEVLLRVDYEVVLYRLGVTLLELRILMS